MLRARSIPYGDPELGVTQRASAPETNANGDRAKIAVIVVDAGSGIGDRSVREVAVAAHDGGRAGDDGAQSTAESIAAAAGKSVIVDASQASPARVNHLLHDGARGVIASLDAERSSALLHGIDRNAFVVDAALGEDDGISHAAHALHRRLYVRDVIADARDDQAYVEFMFRDALAIAQKTGTAIVAVHARTMNV